MTQWMREESIVVAKGRYIAFVSLVLGGSVLPRSVYEEWLNEPKTLEAWHELFKTLQQDSNFASSAEFEARLREPQKLEEELTRGNPKDTTNPFHYSEVILNLSGGMKSYDPTSPYLFKWNSMVDRIAGEVVTFIDDSMRACGFSKETGWQIIRRLTSVLQHLGIQGAPKKRRLSCQSPPGGWIECINKVTPEMVALTVSQEK